MRFAEFTNVARIYQIVFIYLYCLLLYMYARVIMIIDVKYT